MKIYKYEEILKKAKELNCKRHLLLGNGFSIAWNKNIFNYDSLYNSIDFSKKKRLKKVFDQLKTTDFEHVLRVLNDTSKIFDIYSDIGLDKVIQDYKYLQNTLIRAITDNHPEDPTKLNYDEKLSCRKFLSEFNHIYTTNYDILLYWVLMFDENDITVNCDDGFREPDEKDLDYVTWDVEKAGNQTVYYMHGALHLFDNEHEFQKYTWSKTAVKLIEQIREALNENKFPMFVSEGSSIQKMTKIQHNGYLNRALRSLKEIGGCLFIYGLSFSNNDDHIFKVLEKNTRLKKIFISLYGSPKDKENKRLIAKIENSKLADKVLFYDANSAHIWR